MYDLLQIDFIILYVQDYSTIKIGIFLNNLLSNHSNQPQINDYLFNLSI